MTLRVTRCCPECGQTFKAARLDQSFCSPAHKAAFANRNSARGRGGIVQLALAWRNSRNRKEDREVGARAFQELCAALDACAREDRDAGRDPVAYLRRRWIAEGTMKPVRLSQPIATTDARPRPPRRRSNPVLAGSAGPVPLSLNQRVVGSNPTSPTIVSESETET